MIKYRLISFTDVDKYKEFINRYAGSYINSPHFIWLAEKENEIIGALAGRVSENGKVVLGPFAVKPGYRVVPGRLILHCEKKLKELKILGYYIRVKNSDTDRKSTRLNSSHIPLSRMPSSA